LLATAAALLSKETDWASQVREEVVVMARTRAAAADKGSAATARGSVEVMVTGSAAAATAWVVATTASVWEARGSAAVATA